LSKLLLIETATAVCSVAISEASSLIVLEEVPEAPNHAAILTLMIEACVQKSGIALRDLDAVALSGGPGSYSSLRVGASVAKGICYALDKPLIAVDTLASLAQMALTRVGQSAYIVPMLDARRNEVWTAAFDSDGKALCAAVPLVLEEDALLAWLSSVGISPQDEVVFVGNGAAKIGEYPDKRYHVLTDVLCSAAGMSVLAHNFWASERWEDVAYFEPFYMKPPNITTPKAVFSK
jgi:tRNA threonylcarbamoyladenosine biosynthesis protein TsaB